MRFGRLQVQPSSSPWLLELAALVEHVFEGRDGLVLLLVFLELRLLLLGLGLGLRFRTLSFVGRLSLLAFSILTTRIRTTSLNFNI